MSQFKEIQSRIKRFEQAAHSIFQFDETSASRVIDLHKTYKDIDQLSFEQDDLIKQGLRCLEHELYRAAHVMCWSAYIDYLETYSEADGFLKLNGVRPKWKITNITDIHEKLSDYALIEAMKDAKLITKGMMKSSHGLLHRRNECAHPSDYFPDLNMTLGYVSEILTLIKSIIDRRSK